MQTINKQFNRVEMDHRNLYYTNYGFEPLQEHQHAGLIKCKLIHARWGSVIIPDQIYLGHDATRWIQPLNFMPCILDRIDDDDIQARVSVDISCGNTIKVEFAHSDLIQKANDGSELFQCRITGPANLTNFATGDSRLNHQGQPELRLYHHTSDATKPLIEQSKNFRGSKWNIQGNKELCNVHYVYFTCLDRIRQNEDLVQIAMAANGKIRLIRDGFSMPPAINMHTWRDQYGEDILELEVYRESTRNRTATLEMYVRADDLASQHLLFHQPPDGAAYYEVCKPFIQRVGLKPGDVLAIDEASQSVKAETPIYFDHLIAGDATTLEGLSAPFDEESTTDIFKIERTPEGHSIISFWFTFGNQDHFSGKVIEPYQFNNNTAPDKMV